MFISFMPTLYVSASSPFFPWSQAELRSLKGPKMIKVVSNIQRVWNGHGLSYMLLILALAERIRSADRVSHLDWKIAFIPFWWNFELSCDIHQIDIMFRKILRPLLLSLATFASSVVHSNYIKATFPIFWYVYLWREIICRSRFRFFTPCSATHIAGMTHGTNAIFVTLA